MDKFNKKRQEIAKIYSKSLKVTSDFTLPIPEKYTAKSHIFHQYTVRVRNGKRDLLQDELKKDIDTMVYYPMPLHKMAVFKDRAIVPSELRQSEKACEEVLSLPIEPLLWQEEIKQICKKITQSI